APTVISGKIVNGAGGISVTAAVDGTPLGATFTGANGFYYFAVDPRVAGAVLTWISGQLDSELQLVNDATVPIGGAVKALGPLNDDDPNAHATGLDFDLNSLSI